jgi:hypothetical protein
MNLVETELTPELATQLLANPHPRQRRAARNVVETYARAIREGRWRLIGDPICVDLDGHMFNGAHRCSAVIAAHRSIPVMISWDADPETFDLIDQGRRRSAYQFISEAQATARASAARITLWYERRFDRAPQARHFQFDLHEVMQEVERREASFDAMLNAARKTYDLTGLPMSTALAAYSIAFDFGYQKEVEVFVKDVEDPLGLEPLDPARQIFDRFRHQAARSKRQRNSADDWYILVRALNLRLDGAMKKVQLGVECWPRVAEPESDFQRRRWALSKARNRPQQDAARDTKASGVA